MKLLERLKGQEFENQSEINFSDIDNLIVYASVGKIDIMQSNMVKPIVYTFGYRPCKANIKMDISKKDEHTMLVEILTEGNSQKTEINLTIVVPQKCFKHIAVAGEKITVNIGEEIEAKNLFVQNECGDINIFSRLFNKITVLTKKDGNIFAQINEKIIETMELSAENVEIEFLTGKKIKLGEQT